MAARGLAQAVEIRVADAVDSGVGIVTADGAGIYTSASGATNVPFAISINADTRVVSIREFQPSNGDGEFVTDGQHVGRISFDFRRIDVEWTATSDGSKGDFVLIGVRPEEPT